MIRTCPTCADFYADSPVAFCPADGTPLADLDPHGDAWAEAKRVVEEKERLLHRQARRLRLRRVMMLTTTVLITTLVVFVVAVNTYFYLAPEPDAPVIAAALTPTPTPTPRRSETPLPTPTQDSPSLPFVPAVTPTPTPSPTPTPDRVRNPSGPADTGDTPTPTPTPTATPIVTETPTDKETPTDRDEPPRSPTPTPTPTPTRRNELVEPNPTRPSRPPDEPAPAPVPSAATAPASRCTDDDRRRLRDELVAKYQTAWERAIMEDRVAVSRQYATYGVSRPKAKVLKPITYEVEFTDACEPVHIRAVYRWRITWTNVISLFGWCSKKMDASKTFACRKVEAEWRCA